MLLAGLEPEEESPIVFLRLRKATRVGKTQVFSVAALASQALTKLDGQLVPTVPGGEAATLDALPGRVVGALGGEGSLILVGERLASSPGALSAAAALAHETGAKLVWIPRRAGERGAVDAGALPTLLPGGRPVTDPGARAEVEAVWGGSVPTQPGRDIDGILAAAADGSITALVVGGVDPDDTADPALARRAFERAGFIVSLEVRRSAVTEHADVVLPVAPQAEKSGRYVTWEGRRRPFALTIAGTGALSDGRVLNALADELDVDLRLASIEAARDELLRLGAVGTRPAAPAVHSQPTPAGEYRLSTWAELIDAGRLQDGDDHLAGTAKPVLARISPNTAADLGIAVGGSISVSTETGSMVWPVEVVPMADHTVWLPTNAVGHPVRATLAASFGSTVTLGDPGAPPVVGEHSVGERSVGEQTQDGATA